MPAFGPAFFYPFGIRMTASRVVGDSRRLVRDEHDGASLPAVQAQR
ncbi:Uncharacterised protein [Acinetobacter baumannii]|nr:Uncharacterised protein [Acinetobacter baumannii]